MPELGPLGHSRPAHRVHGWCSHCSGRTVAEELAAWQVREDARPTGADAVVERVRNIAEGWERDARLYPDSRIGLAEIAYILRTALEPVDGPPALGPGQPARDR